MDLAGTGPRRVFLLAAQPPVLGTLAHLDTSCNTEAQAASLGGSFLALIAYPSPSPEPHVRYAPRSGRLVVLPSGTQVATDDTFFTISHLHAIDQMADGTPVASGCAWTWFDPNGYALNTTSNCMSWTSADSSQFGAYGDVTGSDVSWCLSNVSSCDSVVCYVYCVEN